MDEAVGDASRLLNTLVMMGGNRKLRNRARSMYRELPGHTGLSKAGRRVLPLGQRQLAS